MREPETQGRREGGREGAVGVLQLQGQIGEQVVIY